MFINLLKCEFLWFRSCDSTFGLDMGHNDELGWFSSSHVIEGSNDATKPSLNFSGCGISDLDGVTEQQEVYGLDNNGLVTDGSNKTLTPVNCKRGSQKLTTNGPSTVMNTSYVDGSWGVSGNDNESQVKFPNSLLSQPHKINTENIYVSYMPCFKISIFPILLL